MKPKKQDFGPVLELVEIPGFATLIPLREGQSVARTQLLPGGYFAVVEGPGKLVRTVPLEEAGELALYD